MSSKEVIPDSIKDEIYSRVSSFFGPHEFSTLKNSFIVVIGLGGVGSHCANMLVRSGISKIRLVDFDQVSLSSLNRHAVADLSDVGIPKVIAMKQKLNNIVPWCQIDTCNEMFCEEQAEKLLQGKPDMVIDCIDDVSTKAQLIAYCIANHLPVITSMGAGGKADPTKIRIGTLADCVKDPLASKMKWKLKKLYKIESELISCIFSVEKPSITLLPLDAEQSSAPDEYGALDNFRIRVMPVLGTSPAIFGQSLASYVMCKITGHAMEPESTESASKSFKHKMKQLLEANELRRYGTKEHVNLDDEDIEFIVRQVWGSRCAVTHNRLGCHFPFTLARWNEAFPPTADNVILVTQRELLLMERARDGGDTSKLRKTRKERKGKNTITDDNGSSHAVAKDIQNTLEICGNGHGVVTSTLPSLESNPVIESTNADVNVASVSVEEEKKRLRAARFGIPYQEKDRGKDNEEGINPDSNSNLKIKKTKDRKDKERGKDELKVKNSRCEAPVTPSVDVVETETLISNTDSETTNTNTTSTVKECISNISNPNTTSTATGTGTQYLSDETIARIESRLQWASIVCSDKKTELMTHHLSAEESILKAQWTGKDEGVGIRVGMEIKEIKESVTLSPLQHDESQYQKNQVSNNVLDLDETISVPVPVPEHGVGQITHIITMTAVGGICFGLGLVLSKYIIRK